jgi:cell fate (sporulation/competence/biofilm development) regulator YlbF (YheA/YmcA/DUF963 family)
MKHYIIFTEQELKKMLCGEEIIIVTKDGQRILCVEEQAKSDYQHFDRLQCPTSDNDG